MSSGRSFLTRRRVPPPRSALPCLEGLEDRVAPATGQLSQQTTALVQQLSQVWGQSFQIEIELIVGIAAVTVELAEARLQASYQAGIQGRSHSANGTTASSTQNSAGGSTSNSSGQGTNNNPGNDTNSGNGTDNGNDNDNGNNNGGANGNGNNNDGNGNGGPNGPGIDNVLSRIVENLRNNVSTSNVLRADFSRIVQMVFAGSSPVDAVAPVPVNILPALRDGGSGVGPVTTELALSQATRLVSPGEAAQALVQFGGGQRSAGIDLTPFTAGGVGVIPQYIVGGTGAPPTSAQTGPGGVFGAAPGAGAAAATPEKGDATTRPVQDLPLKKYLLGPEPQSQPQVELPGGDAKAPETTGRAPSDSDALDEIAETAVTDAVFAGGYEQELDVPELDGEVA
jgi:hypothetical protein